MFMITMFDTAFKSTETGKTDVGLKYNSTRQWLVHWKTFVWCRYCYVSWTTCKGLVTPGVDGEKFVATGVKIL